MIKCFFISLSLFPCSVLCYLRRKLLSPADHSSEKALKLCKVLMWSIEIKIAIIDVERSWKKKKRKHFFFRPLFSVTSLNIDQQVLGLTLGSEVGFFIM